MIKQVIITQDPYLDTYHPELPWYLQGHWPAKWIGHPDCPMPPFVTAYRKIFEIDQVQTIRIHVTADERYELFLDGERIGRGSERGDRENWFFETYDLTLEVGQHILVAKVWAMGMERRAFAQWSVSPGFLLSPEKGFVDLLGTGVAQWDVKIVEGYEFVDPTPAFGTGWNLILEGLKYPWGVEKGEGDGWVKAKLHHDAKCASVSSQDELDIQLLMPGTLPPMIDREVPCAKVRFVGDVPCADVETTAIRMTENLEGEISRWDLIGRNQSITIAPRTRRRVIFDLENYYCAYPVLVTSGGGGSRIRLHWAESLFLEPDSCKAKGNRNTIDDKYFVGVGDTFLPDGGTSREFTTLWWQAGRYIELIVETNDQALTIDHLGLRETRYSLERISTFQSSDSQLDRVIPVGFRAMQMCSHETYMDCPYYEQLMYVGDSRLEALTTYVTTADDRLPRKALKLFNASRINSGLTRSQYPSKVRQIIPPFSLWWIGMVYDYALWRGDRDFIKTLMPGVHAVLDAYLGYLNCDGLVQAPQGWNFMDWVRGWNCGVPPEGGAGVNGLINWQLVYTLKYAAELEEWLDDREMVSRYRSRASKLAKNIIQTFWDEQKGLFAETRDKKVFSEHSQSLAILSDELDESYRGRVIEGLLSDKELAKTTIYFTHYLFEAYQKIGRIDAFYDRMRLWYDLDKYGFKTTYETPEPSRSDCHAWGAHPIYHYFASILGIRPSAMGFDRMTMTPQLGSLEQVQAKLVHPKGLIEIDWHQKNKELQGTIVLPEGVNGTLVYQGFSRPLKSGSQKI
jgi:hypothetical protein